MEAGRSGFVTQTGAGSILPARNSARPGRQCKKPDTATAGGEDVPYPLDIQSDVLDRLGTRLVVPLMPLARYGTPIERLNPRFEIGRAHV